MFFVRTSLAGELTQDLTVVARTTGTFASAQKIRDADRGAVRGPSRPRSPEFQLEMADTPVWWIVKFTLNQVRSAPAVPCRSPAPTRAIALRAAIAPKAELGSSWKIHPEASTAEPISRPPETAA